MRNHRIIASLAVAASILGVSVPSASAIYGEDFLGAPSSSSSSGVTQDLRSPDTRDAAAAQSSSQPSSTVTRQDLRSPDTRDAAAAPSSSQPSSIVTRQDLRSPDTRDVANGVSAAPTSDVEVIRLPGSGSGFDWGDAGIGAGGLALLLMGLGGIAFAMRRTGHGFSVAR